MFSDFSFFQPLAAVVLFALSFGIIYTRQTSAFTFLPGPGVFDLRSNTLTLPLLCKSCSFADLTDQLNEKYGDVFGMWVGLSRVLVTSVPADIVQISSNAKLFPRSQRFRNVFSTVAPGCLFSMDTENHRAVRRTLRGFFRSSILQSFSHPMTTLIAEMNGLLEGYASEKVPMNLSEMLQITSTGFITNVVLGSSISSKKLLQIANAVKGLTEEMSTEYVTYPFHSALVFLRSGKELHHNRGLLHEVCESILLERKSEKRQQRESRSPDVLDALLSLHEQSTETVISFLIEMIAAGSHTIYHTLYNCFYDICRASHVIAAIEGELTTKTSHYPISEVLSPKDLQKLPYIRNVWKEACRLYPVAVSRVRTTTKDIVLRGSGIRVREGTEIHVNLRGSHLNKSIWKDARMFKPERWGLSVADKDAEPAAAGAFAPFGLGQFSCIGRFFANYVGPLIIAETHRRYKFSLTDLCRTHQPASTCSEATCTSSEKEKWFSVHVSYRQ